VHRPAGIAGSEHQTAMAAKVVRVILNQFAIPNDAIDFLGTDHALGTRHLTNRVRQKQQSFLRRGPNIFQNCHLSYPLSRCKISTLWGQTFMSILLKNPSI